MLRQTPMSQFICVQFGHSNTSDQWYNVPTAHSTARAAERYGLDTMCIAGQFGFVVVELRDNEDDWDLLEHRSMLPPKGWWVGCYKGQVAVKKLPQNALV
jgi:hypothetical protein